MQVHRHLNALPKFKNAVVTIGTFDGLHSGHRQIINQLTSQAKQVDGESIIITFHPHPRKIVGLQKQEIKLLHTLSEKIEMLEQAGVDHLVVVPFTTEFSQLTATGYVTDFLVRYFSPHTLIVGYDHRFGFQRQGDFKLLQTMGLKYHFLVKEIPEQLIKNNTVSSTIIRQAIANGHMPEANEALGYVYFFEGTVVLGNQLGRTLGFPTANLQPSETEKLIPGHGVYAVEVLIPQLPSALANRRLTGMMNIGVRPTINGTQRVIEVHIFNFDSNLYGLNVRVLIYERLRSEVKFDGLEALKTQLELDKAKAIHVLANLDKA